MKRFLSLILFLSMILCGIMQVSFSAIAEAEYQDLLPGSKGDEVEKLQHRLAELGYYTGELSGPYSYGNQTKESVKAFQAANNFEQDGIATARVLTVLYSDDAIPAPPKPAVETVSVSKNNTKFKATFKNNTNETITYIEYKFLTYNNDGTIFAKHNSPQDFFDTNYSDIYHYYWYENVNLKPGKTVSINYPLSYFNLSNAPVVYVGISAYITESGTRTDLSEYDVFYLSSTGKQLWPRERTENIPPLSPQDYESSRKIKFGFTSLPITYYLSSYYMLPEGDYISVVDQNSIAEIAGLEIGDVLLHYDSENAKNANAANRAKLRMLNGEDVVVEYWRNNKSHTTLFSLDEERMKAYHEKPEAEVSADTKVESKPLSIADELLKYGELLNSGLITQEEYDLLKQKLINN